MSLSLNVAFSNYLN